MSKRISILLVAVMAIACGKKEAPVSGEIVTCDNGQSIRVQVLSPELIRISAVEGDGFNDRESLVVLPQEPFSDYSVERTDSSLIVATSAARVRIDTRTAVIDFLHADGTPWLCGGKAELTPTVFDGKDAYRTIVRFDPAYDETFYGLGQHQTGEFNHRGTNEELYQYNTKISNPTVLSSAGYGLYFDAYSYSRWGNPDGFRQLGEIFRLYDKEGREGALTGTYTAADGQVLVRREDSLYFENERAIQNLPAIPLSGAKVVYEGSLEPRESGEHYFTQYYAGFQRTLIDGEEVMSERWRPAWNPNSYRYSMSLFEGVRYPVRIEWDPDGDVSYMGLRCAPVQDEEAQVQLCFSSEFEPMLDFYFIAGGKIGRASL